MASSPGPVFDSEASYGAAHEAASPQSPSPSGPQHLDLQVDMEIEPSSPILPALPAGTAARHIINFEFSSDPLGKGHLSPGNSAVTHRLIAFPNRKRGPPESRGQGQEPRTKEATQGLLIPRPPPGAF